MTAERNVYDDWISREESINALSWLHVRPLGSTVKRLLMVSDYARNHLTDLHQLLDRPAWQTLDFVSLIDAIDETLSETDFLKVIRVIRHQALLQLMLLELAEINRVSETLERWSVYAESLIMKSLNYAESKLILCYGHPCDESLKVTSFYPIAMGKLGGCELNFSSDIDLIFAYSASGMTDGAQSIDNQLFYTRLIQRWIHLLNTKTADGLVFRVDLRLRPFGDSGPLVSSISYLESYYQEQGRDWERYAMVKARVIGKPADEVMRFIKPFVYRRYLDFSIIESLRSMKSMIEREVSQNLVLDDIKRGKGGIREVEFIIQTLQIIRAGRMKTLQVTNALEALNQLQKAQLLDKANALKQAYLFLRKMENALQMQEDTQTHALPRNAFKQFQLAQWMGFESVEMLIEKCAQYQRIIRHCFLGVLGKTEAYEDDSRLLLNQLLHLWQGQIEANMAQTLLASLHYDNPARCYELLYAFRHSAKYRRLSQSARLRLESLMIKLLFELKGIKDTDQVLLTLLQLLENIMGRSAYMALLSENDRALKALIQSCSKSPLMSTLLSEHPFLLEVLLNETCSWQVPTKNQLSLKLKTLLAESSDDETSLLILRQFKLVQWTEALRAGLNRQWNEERLGRYLANVAEVILMAVFDLACYQLSHRYPDILTMQSKLSILAYGKLGSHEMHYHSDLDLVFIHEVAPHQEALVIRLTQKILHLLTTRTQGGILYQVDTRLRPSGLAGLLVSHIDAYISYQKNQAWIWEHQALVRSRVILGNRLVREKFFQLKKTVFLLPRDEASLKKSIHLMRVKIQQSLGDETIKYRPGGLLDLEFLVQYWVLSSKLVGLVRTTHTLSLISALYRQGKITTAHFLQLKRAYNVYHQALNYPSQSIDIANELAGVMRICREYQLDLS